MISWCLFVCWFVVGGWLFSVLLFYCLSLFGLLLFAGGFALWFFCFAVLVLVYYVSLV